MQNKKPFLQRLLAIYIAFFIALTAGLALEFRPDSTGATPTVTK